MAEEEHKQSKYNSGIAIILRLDGLWKNVNAFASSGSYKKWNSYLDRVWCELSRDLKEDEFEDSNKEGKKIKGYKSKFEEFDEKIKSIGSFGDTIGDSFNKISKEQVQRRDEIYYVLMEKELFLRRLENHLGKGTAWDDDDEDGFD